MKHSATTTLRPAALVTTVLAAVLLVVLLLTPVAGAATTTTPAETATKGATAKDEPSAAERRAASSDFEREKLDQEAFRKDAADPEAKEAAGKDSGGAGSIFRALFGLVIVLGAIYGVHWLLKKWGGSRLQGVAGRSGVIDVVATTTLAQGRALHLVRVGEELVLVGATENSITRIGEVDASILGASAGNAGNGEFQAMLAGAVYGQQPGVPAGMGGAGSAKDPFLKRFIDNLRLSTAR